MICFAMPVLAGDLCIVHKEEISITCYMCDTYTWQKAKNSRKRQTLLVRKDYYRKGAVAKKYLVVSLKVFDAKTNCLAVNSQS
jgi:hypothetical protein